MRRVRMWLLQGYSFAWGVTHPCATAEQRVEAACQTLRWALRRGWL